MTKKIESLTPEQRAKFSEYVREWTDIGLCTEPADRPRAEAAIAEMYRSGGLAPPKNIVWCGSPMSLCWTHAILKRLPAEVDGTSVRASVWDSVVASVWDSVGDSVRTSVGASVRASVGASVRASVWTSVWDSVGDSVRTSVLDSVWTSVWDSVGASVRASVCGSHDAPWLSFYRFFRDECGLTDETQKLVGLWELANSAGWCITARDVCLVSERHTTLMRDGDGQLHCETGPAVAYPDGWEIYSWRGTTIPAEWVKERAKLDPTTALTWKNVEQRHAAAEIIGWDKVIEHLSPRTIDTDSNPYFGELLECELPDSGPQKFLRAKCGTGRTVVVLASPDAQTAVEAGAMSYGVSVEVYKQLEFRT